jgi:hypothetical protein
MTFLTETIVGNFNFLMVLSLIAVIAWRYAHNREINIDKELQEKHISEQNALYQHSFARK